MRPLALLGVVAALVLGGVAVWDTNANVASGRNSQDRALQAATTAEASLIESGERQASASLAVMLADPTVRSLVTGTRLSPQERASAVRTASLQLEAMQRTSWVPIAAACLVDDVGRQLACAPTARRVSFPQSLGAEFVTLVRGASTDAVSNPFASPLNGALSVALLVPVRIGARMVGVVHLDIDGAETYAQSIVVKGFAGVRVELAAYEGGRLQLNNQTARLTPSGISTRQTLPVQAITIERRPRRLVNGGHRVMVAALPLTFGPSHEGIAVVATARAADPDILNAWSAGMLALLGVALVILVASLSVLARSYREMAHDLRTDPLTGLPNRRALMADLQRACRRATIHSPARLWLFDLNGFKRYNDAFGRVAGDTMIERLAERLQATVDGHGIVYRVGGDEFCVLLHGALEDPEALLEAAGQSFTETGGAFDITASAGSVAIPRDTAEPAQALLLADQRMYHDKATRGADPTELVTAVLSAALAQRHPDLEDHNNDVVGEVELLARAVGLDDEALTLVTAAANLHDIGKLGVPDEIITKPGPLDEHEWEFIKQHTVIGERIIAAAGLPMEGIGPLVRSSHERWDGTGYPDGLAGEEIPLGARIITICDAFGAMIAERVYKPPMSIEETLQELRRCAGTQFDPHLVDVFCRLIGERVGAPQRLRGAVG